MKYLDEYRDPAICQRLIHAIRREVTQRRTIMEVCGGQTHGLLSHGIDELLQNHVALIHGPGCPVCVTPIEAIDLAIAISQRPGVMVASFGDMMRVPGSQNSLLGARSNGADVRMVYSPLDAVTLAQQFPNRQVVFFAVGFETTTPATALAVQQAAKRGLTNFSVLVAHVRVQPAMENIMQHKDCGVEGFLAAGHVCTVNGYESYHTFAETYKVPVVVTGFEPVDLLTGILECIRLIEAGTPRVVNCYERSACARGNRHAARIVDEVYEPCDRSWRGMGVIPGGGFRLRDAWRHFDAEGRFIREPVSIVTPTACRSGEVLMGRIKPTQCECFGAACTPETPLGAPMVSSEGACAAYYRYARSRVPQNETTAR